MSVKVTRESAIDEVNGWLDYKRVSKSKRTENKELIDNLVEGVEEGYLRIDDEKNIIHTLAFPIGEGDSITELVYRPRLTVGDINNKTRGVKATDGDGRVKAYICALCQQSMGVIDRLDSVDYTVPQSIVVFFI